MARNIEAEMDELKAQLAALKTTLAQTTGDAISNAADTIAPKIRKASRALQSEAVAVRDVVRENPGATTGAVVAILAVSAMLAWLITDNSRPRWY